MLPRPGLRALHILIALVFVLGTTVAASPQSTIPPETGEISFTAVRPQGLAFVPGGDFHLEVGRSTGVGPLHFAEVIDGSPVDLGTAPWVQGTLNGAPYFRATLLIASPTAGTHLYQAIFDADGTFEALTLSIEVVVAPVSMTATILADVETVQANHTATLMAQLEGEPTGTDRTGALVWRDTDTDAIVKTGEAGVDIRYEVTPTSVGTRHFRVEYAGDTTHAPAISPTFTLTVVADAVEATGVGIDVPNFYPISDGYRDVVRAKGLRLEAASVRAVVYNSSNRVVRALTAGTASGAYSLAWNGRSTAGNLQPAGRYRIVQTLTDTSGAKLVVAKFVNLSWKRLVYATKYVTKLGSSVSAKGTDGAGSIAISTSGGYARLRATYPGWAGVGYQFTLPSATVYKSIAFQAYVKGPVSVPQNLIGMQNFVTCPSTGTWDESCFDHWKVAGTSPPLVTTWKTASGHASHNRTGRTVRGMLSVNYGTVYLYKVRIKVVVGTLQ